MDIFKKEHPYWALFYHHEGYEMDGDKLMGRQAAGNSFLRALVQDNPDTLGIYIKNNEQKELAKKTISSFLSTDQEININAIPFIRPYDSQLFGGIFLPGPSISESALARGFYSHNQYSLVGITHTTASHNVMTGISDLLTSPVMPWDGVICTSNVVADTLSHVINETFDQLKFYLGASKRQLPQFPVIPLGVHPEDFDYSDEFKVSSREKLKIDKDDIVIVYVGRLSFHAKAHHLPMYIALEEASKSLSKGKIHLIQTGWFANEFIEKAFKDEAELISPNIKFHFLDGKNQENKHISLSSGDIFMSLSDNFQETFGLTPLEGMASGLPVIVSDWNGYKSTVRNNIDGFKIPTYSLNSKSGEQIAYNHMMGFINYDQYIGQLSQRVAIDIGICIEKLKILIENKNLRNELGLNAKESAKNIFSWNKILKQYRDFSNELDNIRIKSQKKEDIPKFNLPADRQNPFSIFDTYPSLVLENDSRLIVDKNNHNLSIKEIMNLKSINFALDSFPSSDNFFIIEDFINSNDNFSVNDISINTKLDIDDIKQIIIWLIKYSFVKMVDEKNE